MRQILGWSVLVRVDGLTYSFLGNVDPNLVNGTVNLNSTYFAIGPTYTLLSGNAGPMQVTLRFLNPIEVCCHSFVSSMSTYRPSKARGLGQAIHPIFIHVFHRKFNRWRKSSCAGVFRCQRRYVQSFSEARRFSSTSSSLQSGTRGIERNRFYGPRRSMTMLFSTVSDSRIRKHWYSRRYSTKRSGVRYIMP
jgi:hypothetical protein